MIPCPGCGASLTYDIKSASMLCAYCGEHYDPYLFDGKKVDAKSSKIDSALYLCPSCGAELITDRDDLSVTCSYCGGANLIFQRMAKTLRPESIIPFGLTREEAIQRYMQKARRAFLSPGKYRKKSVVDDFRGIYMPFWSYDVKMEGVATIEYTSSKMDGDYKVTTTETHNADLKATISGYAHDASKDFDDTISECLSPFDSSLEKPFTPGYLCGLYASTSDMNMENYSNTAESAANLYAARRIIDEAVFKPDQVHLPRNKNKVTAHRVLYPVWFLSVRTGDSITYATVNGSNGKVVADFPVSMPRMLLLSLVFAGLIYAFLSLFVMLTPTVSVITGALLMLIGLIANSRAVRLLDMRSRGEAITYRPNADTFKKIGSILTAVVLIVLIGSCIGVIPLTGHDIINELEAFIILVLDTVLFILYFVFFFKAWNKIVEKYDSKTIGSPIYPSLHLKPLAIFILVLVDIILIILDSMPKVALFTLFLCMAGIIVSAVISMIVMKKGMESYSICFTAMLEFLFMGTMASFIGKPLNIYYWMWDICCLVAFVILFAAAIKIHAGLGTRRPPQFDKRGNEK